MFDIIRPITKVITDDIDDDFSSIESLKTHLINTIKNYKDYLNNYLLGTDNEANYLKFDNFNDFKTSVEKFGNIVKFNNSDNKLYGKLFNDHIEIIGVSLVIENNILNKYSNFIEAVLKDYIKDYIKFIKEEKITKKEILKEKIKEKEFIKLDKYYINNEAKLFNKDIFKNFNEKTDIIFGISYQIETLLKDGKKDYINNNIIFNNVDFAGQLNNEYGVKFETKFIKNKEENNEIKFSKTPKIITLKEEEEEIIKNLDGYSPERNINKEKLVKQLKNNSKMVNELIEFYKFIKLLKNPFHRVNKEISNYISETLNGNIGNIEKTYQFKKFANKLLKDNEKIENIYKNDIIKIGEDGSIKTEKVPTTKVKYLNIELGNGFKINLEGKTELGKIKSFINNELLYNEKIVEGKKRKEKILTDNFKNFVNKNLHSQEGTNKLNKIKNELLKEDSYKSLLVKGGITTKYIDKDEKLKSELENIITPSYKFELPKPPKKEKKK